MANEGWLIVGLGAAALWMFGRGTENNLVDTASTASGMGAAPRQPEFVPIVFNVPGTNVPWAASTDEDIGVYPGPVQRGALDFSVATGPVAAGTSDNSPVNPAFTSSQPSEIVTNAWENAAAIAAANDTPIVKIRETMTGGVAATTNIATLSSKEQFTVLSDHSAFPSTFQTTPDVLVEYVAGFAGGGADYFDQPPRNSGPEWAIPSWGTSTEPDPAGFLGGWGEG
jgi:hypothetical protein